MHKIFLLFVVFILFIPISVSAWTSPNEGTLYTMDDLCALSDSICFNDTTYQYEVRCDINILGNDTLKLNPGEIIKFFEFHEPQNVILYGIQMYGCFKAIGTEEELITLGDTEADFWIQHEGWNGIKFYNTSFDGESILKYCNIISAQDMMAYTAIYCENAAPIIDHCNISYMWADIETGGGSGIYCAGQSYPIVSYCTFENLRRSVAVWCGNVWIDTLSFANWDIGDWGWQDTVNYPSPLMIGCNIMPSVQSFWGYGCDYDKVVLNGGFLDNCYIGITEYTADITLGCPIDTIGDGICTTNSTQDWEPKYWLVDGVVNPRVNPDWTGINEEEIDILPTTSEYLVLNKNYPNPFNPITTITYTLPEKTPVTLNIYDITGKLVTTLVDAPQPRGYHTVQWNGTDHTGDAMPSGVYFYRLHTDNGYEKTHKMLLLK